MVSSSSFKNTFLFLLVLLVYGLNSTKISARAQQFNSSTEVERGSIVVGAERLSSYQDKLRGKKVGILTNQTGTVYSEKLANYISTVDYLLENGVDIHKIYAPEHGFRGTANAGELIKDGKDAQTGLPILSLYGNSKKPSKEQLKGIDVMLFDLQDVGARFYTYISSLHYVMEACAEQNIPLIVLDRPNPIGATIDGPTLEIAHQSFIGMHPIPTLHGLTIGEYSLMINGEKWLNQGIQCRLTVISCLNYNKSMTYDLPVPPSPNLPNSQAVNLYASLCFFEGTNVSSGRGTDKQFQIYGSPFLQHMPYQFTPMPNAASKDPMNKGKLCHGEDLSQIKKVTGIELKWLLKAYRNSSQQERFFTDFFTKLAGTKQLAKQIKSGLSEQEIRLSWKKDLEAFEQKRKAYLLY